MTESPKKNSPGPAVTAEPGTAGTKLPPQTRQIILTEGLTALIDEADYELINPYKWYANRFRCSLYACTKTTVKGRKRTLRMHRLIAKTPPSKVTHHLNHNSLDNRRSNLLNLTPQEHMLFHSNNSIRVKFEQKTRKTQL